MADTSCDCAGKARCQQHAPVCQECNKPSKWPLSRGRCNACYLRLRKAAVKAGTFIKTKHSIRSVADRLLDKVAAGRNGCWIYTGAVGRNGYGYFAVSAKERTVAHRISYRTFVGQIPDDCQIDHVCHNQDQSCRGGDACLHRRCINPAHLEAVAPRENTLRSPWTTASKWAARTHCNNGHEYTPETSSIRYRNGRPVRICRPCAAARARKANARKGAGR